MQGNGAKEISKRLQILNKSNDGFYIAGEDLTGGHLSGCGYPESCQWNGFGDSVPWCGFKPSAEWGTSEETFGIYEGGSAESWTIENDGYRVKNNTVHVSVHKMPKL